MDLAAYRLEKGLSQSQVAAALGIASRGHICELEAGSRPFSIKLALKVERWSGGQVRAVDLLSPEDAQLLQAAIDAASTPVEAAA
jgi:transcriptional regulator with XRE-family HTH domain